MDQTNTGEYIGTDEEVMLAGCTALLQTILGNSNWERWEKIRRQHTSMCLANDAENESSENLETISSSSPHLHTFVHWLLDLADEQMFTGNDVYCGDVFGDEIEQHNQSITMEMSIVPPYTAGDTALVMIPQFDNSLGEEGGCWYSCEGCDVTMSDVCDIDAHVSSHHGPSSHYVVRCSHCVLTFISPDQYLAHHKEVHTGGGKKGPVPSKPTTSTSSHKYTCTYCDQAFSRAPTLREHIANRHHKALPRYTCPICGSKFRYGSGLSRHRHRCNKNNILPLASSTHGISGIDNNCDAAKVEDIW